MLQAFFVSPALNYVAIRAWLLLKHEMDINVTSKDFSAWVDRRHVEELDF